MTRQEVQNCLAQAHAVARDPRTVFCIEPISSIQDENGERLSRLLARVVANPHDSLIIITGDEFVFGFINDENEPETWRGRTHPEYFGGTDVSEKN